MVSSWYVCLAWKAPCGAYKFTQGKDELVERKSLVSCYWSPVTEFRVYFDCFELSALKTSNQ